MADKDRKLFAADLKTIYHAPTEQKGAEALDRVTEKWNEKYWVQIKMDLMKNFSEKRFSHMREVAKVIYAEKIKRLEQERRKAELHNQQIEKEQREQRARIEKARMEQQKAREAANSAHGNETKKDMGVVAIVAIAAIIAIILVIVLLKAL